MKAIIVLFVSLLFLLGYSCSSDGDVPDPDSGGGNAWLIPEGEVLEGGPGKDGIPALDDPCFYPGWRGGLSLG